MNVPVYNATGVNIISWKKAKRNQWQIDNTRSGAIKVAREYKVAIKLDSDKQAIKQLANREKFMQQKKLLLDPTAEERLALQPKHHLKY